MDCILGADRAATVHRYMTITKLVDLVATSQLFFPKISIFPDKLEGSLTSLDRYLQPDMMAALDRMVNRVLPAATLQPRGQNDEEEGEDAHRIDIETVFGPMPVFTNQKNRTSFDIIEEQREWLFAQCWHIANSESESVAM